MPRGQGPTSTPLGCLMSCPPTSFPFPLRVGASGTEKPPAKVMMFGGGNGSREVSAHTKANTIRSSPNISFPRKAKILAVSAQVIPVKASISSTARAETTLSLSSYFRHTQELMPKTCINLRNKAA